ncbi:alpha glucosidase [Shewanella sp. SR43-4]|uniref:alpha-glucosidase n=1 Tax=Shewanella TaxID=22 RepID=UPI000C55F645|nr:MULTISPECIES: alpha-glucosidase [Shewanella]NCQ43749.1 alpha-glucosidase [Shewanella frigidimarina]MBB1316960.1 alpha glucosidase [Shewanella sp. SR43-4]MBB1321838.1 alpha glucosidase [Shewanella sp. SR43-8]MBB1390593.1 alpha glucosidase [Shewanella sp. SG44-6]NCO70123.1 alpha-glucosidase [Shewanella vesiculosa]
MGQVSWWRGGVIYQVYPRSLMDTNGDGVGDLQGIIAKLDYIASLNVDAIWISPFFKSPMKDFGYDISDYLEIDPLFGTMADFDQLIEKAHQLNIKVVIDQVLSHTSDQHAWFEQSRQSRDNDKADWYVWADPKDDGSAPNNWLAIFGGCAWEWEPRRQQYYLHNFLKSQPDVNFHCPQARQAVLDNVEFWLKKGVDGFRLDAITFCYHDEQLRDNPAKPKDKRQGRGFSEDNPYAYQYHYYNNTRPQTVGFIEQLRALINRYPGAVTLGEVSSEDSLATMAEYTQGDDRLHMAYSFELLTDDFSAAYIRQTVEELEASIGDGWPCWAIGNHDVKRVASRWGKASVNPTMVKMLNAMLFSLRGSVCSYQGEELGLTEASIEYDQLQDPFGIAFWPMFKGRDGCRTPMPWVKGAANAGFTEATPWLPIDPAHNNSAVDVQEADQDSILQSYRHFLQWRKKQHLLIEGDITFIDSHPDVLAFIRSQDDQRMLVLFNLCGEQQTFALNELRLSSIIDDHGLLCGAQDILDPATIVLPSFASFYGLLG